MPRPVVEPPPGGQQRSALQPVAGGDTSDQRRCRLPGQGHGAQGPRALRPTFVDHPNPGEGFHFRYPFSRSRGRRPPAQTDRRPGSSASAHVLCDGTPSSSRRFVAREQYRHGLGSADQCSLDRQSSRRSATRSPGPGCRGTAGFTAGLPGRGAGC